MIKDQLLAMTKKSAIAFIKDKLATDYNWAVRGMQRIFTYQTETEKATSTTRDQNGVGFSGVDAEILTSFTQQVCRGHQLSPKQQAILFRKMPRYAGQLYRIMSGTN